MAKVKGMTARLVENLAAVLAALAASALSTRRNMGIPAMLATPLIAAAFCDAASSLRGRLGGGNSLSRFTAGVGLALLAFCGIASGWWLAAVVDGRFAADELRASSFGRGVSELALPRVVLPATVKVLLSNTPAEAVICPVRVVTSLAVFPRVVFPKN